MTLLTLALIYQPMGSLGAASPALTAVTQFQASALQTLKTAVVSIQRKTSFAAYDSTATIQGTGFVCAKKEGFILTNHHVVGYGVAAQFTVTFFDGTKADADVLYVDPWYDFAFLKLREPQHLSAGISELSQFQEPQVDETIAIAGNNQGQSFSLQTGRVTALYQDSGFMPEPTFGVLVNSAGGSSGSPVVNTRLQVLGINYAGRGDGTAFALHAAFLKDALAQLKKSQQPPRHHCGAILRLTSLESLIKRGVVPKHVAKDYVKNHPEALYRVFVVEGTLQDSPASTVLEPGDVVMAVNGQAIGTNSYILEHAMNTCTTGQVDLSIFRRGQALDLQVGLYDLNETTVKRLLFFGGMTFFEADDLMRWQFGVPSKHLMGLNVMASGALAGAFATDSVHNTEYGQRGGAAPTMVSFPEYSFDALVAHIPDLVKNKNFTLSYVALTGMHSGYSGITFFNRQIRKTGVAYMPSQNSPPQVFSWSPEGWSGQRVICHP